MSLEYEQIKNNHIIFHPTRISFDFKLTGRRYGSMNGGYQNVFKPMTSVDIKDIFNIMPRIDISL